MLLKKTPDIRSSEITDQKLYLRRREFIQAAAMGAVGAAAGGLAVGVAEAASWPRVKIPNVQKVTLLDLTTTEKPNSYQDITTYNNFYEFGSGKDDPSNNAGPLTTKPWTVKIDGLVNKPGDYHLDDLIKPYTLEERVYRMRCVERWSVVVPWVGFPLASLLKTVDPKSTAKFVEFTTLVQGNGVPYPPAAHTRTPSQLSPFTLLRSFHRSTLIVTSACCERVQLPPAGPHGDRVSARTHQDDLLPLPRRGSLLRCSIDSRLCLFNWRSWHSIDGFSLGRFKLECSPSH